jgi:diacylglycerol kinase family enzyme
VTIAVVTNPRSKHNRRNPGLSRSLAYVLGEQGEVVEPGDLDALAATSTRFRERGIGTLCVNGGDGTLHQVLTSVIRTWGEDGALPAVAILRGGTMNIIADSVGVRADAETMLGRVVEAVHAGEALPTVTRRTLRIELDGGPAYYGFLAGNGIIARFLELYYEQPDPSPVGAAKLLARGALSAMVGGALIRRLTRPYSGQVVLDGRALPNERWVAVAVGTVEQMGLGFRVFHLLRDHPDRLQVVALGGSVADLARELPSVYRGRGVHRPGDSTAAVAELVWASAEPVQLMIDGDFYVADGGRVRFSVGPEVRFVLP